MSTEMVQVSLAARVAPLRLIVDVPASAVIKEASNEQSSISPLSGVAITKPVGSVSENATPVRAEALGLLMVKVRLLVLPCAMGSVANALSSSGGAGSGQPVMLTLSIQTALSHTVTELAKT